MKILPRLFRVLLTLSLWLLLLTTSLSAQSDGTFTLTAASLQNGDSVELSKLNWKYQPGDDPSLPARSSMIIYGKTLTARRSRSTAFRRAAGAALDGFGCG